MQSLINYAPQKINFRCAASLSQFALLITYFAFSFEWVFSLQDLHDCGAPCHAMFFPERERTVLRYWVGSWAAICVASCLFTVSERTTVLFIFNLILMRARPCHNVRHSIFNLTAINHQRQNCSTPHTSHYLRLSLLLLFAQVSQLSAAIFSFGLRTCLEGPERSFAYIYIYISLTIRCQPLLCLCSCSRFYYVTAETTLALWPIPRIDILPVRAYFSISLAKHMVKQSWGRLSAFAFHIAA